MESSDKVHAQTQAPLNTGTGRKSATAWSHSCAAIEAPHGVASNDRVISGDAVRCFYCCTAVGPGRGTFPASASIERCLRLRLDFR